MQIRSFGWRNQGNHKEFQRFYYLTTERYRWASNYRPRSENPRDDRVRKTNCRALSGGTDGNPAELFDGAGETV